MGGFISGPVIKFTIDESSLVAQVQSALANVNQQVQAQNKQISSSIANPLIAQAAQLRALYSTGSIALKDMQVQQRNLISLLDTQIKQLATADALTKSQLATLRQLTLERERQQNALNRGVGVGVTAGTSSALSTVSGPIIANISRLGAGLLGVAGGSGGSGFNGAASAIASIASSGGAATAVLGGLTIALLAAGGAAASLAISGGELVLQLSNISQRTGISIQNLQTLGAVAGVSNLGLEDIVIGFRKFSQALSGGDGLDTGDGTGGLAGAGKKASEILQILGVTSKDSFTAIEQTAEAFQQLPDGPLKAAAAVALFGRSGLQLIPILNKGKDGVEEFRTIVNQFGPNVDQSAIQSTQNWKLATEKLSLAFDSLKVSATPILNLLSSVTTESAKFLKVFSSGSTGGLSDAERTGLSIFTLGGSSIGQGISGTLAIQQLKSQLTDGSASAASFGTAMDKAFSTGESAAKKLSPNVKALKDLLDGTTDALRKLQEEGAKELQSLTDEAAKAALGKLNTFSLTGDRQNPNASAADNILTKQRQDLEEIANIMLNFPSLSNQVQAAVVGVSNTTISELEKLANESLKKAQDAADAESAERIKNERELNNLIRGANDDLAVARAQSTRNGVAAIIAEEQKRLDDAIAKATLLGATEQQLQNLRVIINQEASAKIVKLRQEEINKTTQQVESEAGRLFDALISSGGNFTKQLKTSLENLFLQPVKSVFSAVVGGVLTGPVQAGKDILTNFGRQLQTDHPTGILNSIGKGLAPESAIGNNTGALNTNTQALNSLTGALSGGAGGASSSGSSFGGLFGGISGTFNPLTDPLPLGNVSQELANLTGVLSGTNTSASTNPNSLGAIFKNLTGVLTGTGTNSSPGSGVGLFGGGTGLILHGFGGSSGGAAGTQLFNGPLGQLLGPALTTGALFAAGGRGLSPALGGLGSILASGVFGKGTGASIGGLLKDPASQGTLGLLGLTAEGAGIALAGHQTGGVLGGLEGAAGGALSGASLGTLILPGIGTAIGAGIGAIAGFIGGILGHHGFSSAQIAAAVRRQTVDPNKFVGQEFDRAAESNFASTLNTTFSEGPGGQFSSSSIRGPQSAGVVNFNVSAVDAKSVVDLFSQHGGAMAQIVAGKINSTQSGLARQIRAAVGPA
jgi:hypothetical protein